MSVVSFFLILGILFLLAASFLRGMMLYSARHLGTGEMPFFGTPAVTAAAGIISVVLASIGAFFIGRIHGAVLGIVSFAGFWVFAAIWEPLIDASRR